MRLCPAPVAPVAAAAAAAAAMVLVLLVPLAVVVLLLVVVMVAAAARRPWVGGRSAPRRFTGEPMLDVDDLDLGGGESSWLRRVFFFGVISVAGPGGLDVPAGRGLFTPKTCWCRSG